MTSSLDQPKLSRAELRREIEREHLSRRLSHDRLKHFVGRQTPEFIPGWHIDEICASLEVIEQKIQKGTGLTARLILEAPPRHAKSQCTSKCFALWYLARHPQHEVIVATYGQDLADDIGRWAKAQVDDPSFKAVFPDFKLRKGSKANNRMETQQGGGIRFVGRGGALTGRGGHLIVVDDPLKDAEEAESEAILKSLWDWYTSTLRTRLAPGGGIVIMHTRWSTQDLIGRLLEDEQAGGEQWIRKTFKAIAEEDDPWGRAPGDPLHSARFTREDMDALKRAMLKSNPKHWYALYQQEPIIEAGNIFKTDDFTYYKPGEHPSNLYWYIVCDLAVSTKTTADYSVIWPVGVDSKRRLYFAPDFVKARIPSDQSIAAMLDLAGRYKARGIIVEGGPILRAIEPILKRSMRESSTFYEIIDPTPTKDKVTRSRPLHIMMQQGLVFWPDTNGFREKCLTEFLVFDGLGVEHDDTVDAAAWAACVIDRLLCPHDDDSQAAGEVKYVESQRAKEIDALAASAERQKKRQRRGWRYV